MTKPIRDYLMELLMVYAACGVGYAVECLENRSRGMTRTATKMDVVYAEVERLCDTL